MTVSVIMPTYNQLQRFKISLESVVKQISSDDMEVIVINDGSTDGTKEYLDSINYDGLKVIHQENRGRSYTRNLGIQLAQGNILIFIDGDMVVTDEMIISHVKYQQQQPAVYLSNIYNIPERNYKRFLEIYNSVADIEKMKQLEEEDILVNMGRYFNAEHVKGEVSWPCMTGASISIHKQYIDLVGEFDTFFKGWGLEDHEYAYRLNQAGAKFIFLRDVAVFHLDYLKGQIDMNVLIENVVYLRKKYMKQLEMETYVDFILERNTIQDLYQITMKCKDKVSCGQETFNPFKHVKNKINKGDIYGRETRRK